MAKQVVLRIEQSSEQIYGPVRKIIGLLGPKAFCQLLDSIDLSANPRSAKRGPVTAEIEASLQETPDLFPAKTKGLLLASSTYKSLERQRYQLTFKDTDAEGLLDGGHNALGAGRHVLREAGVVESDLKRIADWATFATAWRANRDLVKEIEDSLNFHIPVEIQVPADMHDEDVIDTFTTSLLEIGAARNNNVQLSDETKANKQGLYDDLKAFLPESISKRVEWKANDGGEIKAKEVVALTWIPLSLLDLPRGIRVNPNQIYRNKGFCVEKFNELLRMDEVSTQVVGAYERQLSSESVRSAIKIGAGMPEIYDYLVARFPDAYNKAGGSFGRITAVRMFDLDKVADKNPKYLRRAPRSPFLDKEMAYTCPDGFVVPMMYGLRALLRRSDDGLLSWRVDPVTFLNKNLVDLMRSYKLVLELGAFDPQKVGKNISAYDFAEKAIAAIATTARP